MLSCSGGQEVLSLLSIEYTWHRRDLLELRRKKKKVYDLWKKWQATQEGYKDAVRLRREEVRRTKGWLELNLDATVKDNKNVFIST